ncbi:MAG: hypothetical protein ABI040_12450 [Rhodoferax sp.]
MPAAKRPASRKTPAPKRPASARAKPVAPPSKASLVDAKAMVEPKADKPAKVKKPKLVRDSFTIPKAEYGVFDELKQRAAKLAHPVKKSELLRAGVKALAAMPDTGFLAALQAVPTIKTGRPAQS